MEHAMDEAAEKLNPKPKKEKKAKPFLDTLIGKKVMLADKLAGRMHELPIKLVEIDPRGFLVLERDNGTKFATAIDMVGGIGEDKGGA